MFRSCNRNLIWNRQRADVLKRGQHIQIVPLSSIQNLSTFKEEGSNSNQSSKRDPEKVKRAKLLDVLIASSIGIIGFGYLLVRRIFSDQLHAKSAEGLTSEISGSVEKVLVADGEGNVTQMQRKKRKTFKETRVGYVHNVR